MGNGLSRKVPECMSHRPHCTDSWSNAPFLALQHVDRSWYGTEPESGAGEVSMGKTYMAYPRTEVTETAPISNEASHPTSNEASHDMHMTAMTLELFSTVTVLLSFILLALQVLNTESVSE